MKSLKPIFIRLEFNLSVCFLKNNRNISLFFLCVGVGRYDCTLHWGVWICLFFWFGLFVFCVWEEGLVHTCVMDAMLGSVGVVCGACWRFCFSVNK